MAGEAIIIGRSFSELRAFEGLNYEAPTSCLRSACSGLGSIAVNDVVTRTTHGLRDIFSLFSSFP